MEYTMKDWERTIRQLGEHWTGSPAEMTQARIAVCEMCAGCYIKGRGLFRANLQEDVRQEMAVLMLERLEKFDPSRVSAQDKDGNQTDNALLKFVLSNAGYCRDTALANVLQKNNMDGGESMRSLPKDQRNLRAIRLDQLVKNEVDDKSADQSFRIANPRDDMEFTDATSQAQAILCAVAGVILNFCNAPGSGRNTVLSRWFMPMCFSEHMAYITENDRGEILLRQRLMAQYHKNVLNALDWNYLRFFADGLPEQPDTLGSLYRMKMRLASELFPQGEDVALRFRGESFFLEARVPIAYYAACTGEMKQDSFVSGQRKRYTELLVQLRPE